jgi:hypothetical protein
MIGLRRAALIAAVSVVLAGGCAATANAPRTERRPREGGLERRPRGPGESGDAERPASHRPGSAGGRKAVGVRVPLSAPTHTYGASDILRSQFGYPEFHYFLSEWANRLFAGVDPGCRRDHIARPARDADEADAT